MTTLSGAIHCEMFLRVCRIEATAAIRVQHAVQHSRQSEERPVQCIQGDTG